MLPRSAEIGGASTGEGDRGSLRKAGILSSRFPWRSPSRPFREKIPRRHANAKGKVITVRNTDDRTDAEFWEVDTLTERDDWRWAVK